MSTYLLTVYEIEQLTLFEGIFYSNIYSNKREYLTEKNCLYHYYCTLLISMIVTRLFNR